MAPASSGASGIVERYLTLGLATGRHIDGFVDAYYGPAELSSRAASEPIVAPAELVRRARELLGAIDAAEPLGDVAGDDGRPSSEAESAARRRFVRAQTLGLLTTARLLGGEVIGYADEVEACYGVRPTRVADEVVLEAHRSLEEVVPGSGALAERLIAWREAQAVPPELLSAAVGSLAEDLRARTAATFGLPDGEHVEFELVTNRPWSGFNYYLGNLSSRVAINVDLPVLSTSLAHLVADESYPGHHTEHSRKEVGLVRSRHFLEESIFLVGTPQCLIAEGLADLGLEVTMGRRPERLIAEHFRPLHIPYDPDVVAVVAEAGEALAAVRANAAFRLHEDHADPEVVVAEVADLGLLPVARAKKTVEFLLDPTWRSYISCYTEGLPLVRRFVAGHPERFARLITEQLVPADLAVVSTVRSAVPPRSVLIVPGSSRRFLDKAPSVEADAFVLDLEDAVAQVAKATARDDVVRAVLHESDFSARPVAVRVNRSGSAEYNDDVATLVRGAGAQLSSLMLPKVDGPEEVLALDSLLQTLEAGLGLEPGAIGIDLQIESARGLLNAAASCAASVRVTSVVIGPADLSASLRLPVLTTGTPAAPAAPDALDRAFSVLVAGRAAGVAVIDGPELRLGVPGATEESARRARALGFDGKWAIHPDQVAVLNGVFAPSSAEVERAEAILSHLDLAATSEGRGAVRDGDEMLDEASRQMALAVLARRERSVASPRGGGQ